MELAGHNDLQGRSAYQPIIISQDGRHIAYVRHHATQHLPMNPLTGKAEPSGVSIVDVTDPTNTKYLAHIPGPPRPEPGRDAGGSQMVRVCGGDTLPGAGPAHGTCCDHWGERPTRSGTSPIVRAFAPDDRGRRAHGHA